MNHAQSDPYFVVGGTLTRNAVSYVERQADAELLAALMADEYCYVLDTRQVGKSSLIVRAAQHLSEAGRLTAFLDLSTFGDSPTEEQWYGKLLADLVRATDMEDEADAFWEGNSRYSGAQRWFLAVRDLVLPNLSAPMVVFVDEIEAVRKLPFSFDGFFAMIRAFHNLRATEPNAMQLTFCLTGVATPAELIRDPQTTPFNIGRRITLRDFTSAEMRPLAQGLHGTPVQREAQLRRIGDWTSGHPYLTQRFCHAAFEAGRPLDAQEIDALCQEVFLRRQAQSEEANLHFVRRQILDDTASDELLMLYARVRAGRRIEAGNANALTDRLLLSGLVRVDTRQEPPRLMIRNLIYAQVFDQKWASENMSGAEAHRQRQALRRGVLRASLVWCVLAASLLFALIRQREVVWQHEELVKKTGDLKQVTAELKTKEDFVRTATADSEKRGKERMSQQNKMKAINAAIQGLRQDKQAEHTRLVAVQTARRLISKRVFLLQQKQAALQEQSDERNASDRAVQLSAISGQGFEALGSGLEAVEHARSRGRLPLPEAIQSLGQAANAGIYRLLRLPHPFRLETARFSSSNQWIVTAGHSRYVYLWKAGTRTLPLKIPVLAADILNPVVWTAEFSPDGKYLITTGSDQKAHIWEFSSLHSPLPHCIWEITCGSNPSNHVIAQFSQSGRYVAVTGRSSGRYCATVLDFLTQKPIAVQQNDEEIESIDFNNKIRASKVEERYLAVAGGHHSPLHILDFLSNKEVASPRPNGESVQRACFGSWNDDLYCTGNTDTLFTWHWHKDTRPDPVLESVTATYAGHQGSAALVTVSPDGYLLASTGLEDHQVRLWNLWYRDSPLYTLVSPDSNATSIHFSEDSSRIVIAQNQFAEVWLLNGYTYGGAGNKLLMVSRSPDGSSIAAPTTDRVTLWNTEQVTLKQKYKNWARQYLGDSGRSKFSGRVNHVLYSPDGKHLATAGANGEIRLWTVASNLTVLEEYVPLEGHNRALAVNCVAFSPDSRLLLSASDDDTARLWEVQTRKQLRTLVHPGKVRCSAFSPDGTQMLTGCSDGIVRLYDLEGRLQREIRSPRSLHEPQMVTIWSIAVSPDGRSFVTGTADGNAYIWERATGRLSATLPCGHGNVFSAQFSPDGQRILTVGDKGYAELWNVNEALQATRKGQRILPWLRLYSNSASLYGGEFSPDGKYIYVAGADCLVSRYSITLETFLQEARRIRHLAGIQESPTKQIPSSEQRAPQTENASTPQGGSTEFERVRKDSRAHTPPLAKQKVL